MYKPGFHSNVPRFSKTPQANASYSYENFDLANNSKQMKASFKSKVKRIEFYKVNEVPSVGVYRARSHWVKPSFNVNYNSFDEEKTL